MSCPTGLVCEMHREMSGSQTTMVGVCRPPAPGDAGSDAAADAASDAEPAGDA